MQRNIRPISTTIVRGFSLALFVGMLAMCPSAHAATMPAIQDNATAVDPANQESDEKASKQRSGNLVRIQLPITSKSITPVKQSIERLLEKAPALVRPEERPIVVMEFDTSNGKNGRGSQFEACLELARFLSRPDMNRLELMSFIPGPKGYVASDTVESEPVKSQLNGHAVLVAITGQLAMHPKSTIGLAGYDEENLEELIKFSYNDIASRRLKLPPPMVLSMLDKSMTLYRAPTAADAVFVDEDELAKLEAANKADGARKISEAGTMASFTAQELFDFRLISLLPESRKDLARKLNLPATALEGDPALGKEWVPVQFTMPDYIDSKTVQWLIRGLETRSPNLIIARINSNGGDPDACLRLAEKLADYDPNQVRTVAYISGVARGPAAMLALVCDHIIMAPDAELGGEFKTDLVAEDFEQIRPKLVELARKKGNDWSILAASIDPSLEVTRYSEKTTGQVRLLSPEEYDELGEEKSNWLKLGLLGLNEGIDATKAEDLFIARSIAEDMQEVENFYQLSESPVNLEPSMADRWLEEVARSLASPFIAPWLLMGAVFFISTEMSAPGIGIPGFLGTLCLILFFWSQYFEGNAHWLEILLFVAGVVFVMLELFALPGFGIFGVGGLLMIVISLILATQTFGLIPQTSDDFAKLPASLMPVAAAGVGFVVAMYTMRKVLPNAPYFKRMMLEPRVRNEDEFGNEKDPEALVDWSGLVGRTGKTVTRLAPSGKARIGSSVYDVITDGRMVDKGCKIKVNEVIGNRIEVQEIQDA